MWIGTPSKVNINSFLCSTPVVSKSDGQSKDNLDISKQSKPDTRDAPVNTTIDLDLNFQIPTVTDKCIELEKSVMEIRTSPEFVSVDTENKPNHYDIEPKQNEDFHIMILKQELSKYKLNNQNLQKTIEMSQGPLLGIQGLFLESSQYPGGTSYEHSENELVLCGTYYVEL